MTFPFTFPSRPGEKKKDKKIATRPVLKTGEINKNLICFLGNLVVRDLFLFCSKNLRDRGNTYDGRFPSSVLFLCLQFFRPEFKGPVKKTDKKCRHPFPIRKYVRVWVQVAFNLRNSIC